MVVPEMGISSSSHKLVIHDLLKALKQEVNELILIQIFLRF